MLPSSHWEETAARQGSVQTSLSFLSHSGLEKEVSSHTDLLNSGISYKIQLYIGQVMEIVHA